MCLSLKLTIFMKGKLATKKLQKLNKRVEVCAVAWYSWQRGQLLFLSLYRAVKNGKMRFHGALNWDIAPERSVTTVSDTVGGGSGRAL